LLGLQEEVRPRHALRLAANARDDLIRRGFVFFLELNEDLRIGTAPTTAARAGVHADGVDIRVGAHLLLKPFRFLTQRLERDVLLPLDLAVETSGILLREKSLGNFYIEITADSDRDEHDDQRGGRVIQNSLQG